MRARLAFQCAEIAEMPECRGEQKAMQLGLSYKSFKTKWCRLWIGQQDEMVVVSIIGCGVNVTGFWRYLIGEKAEFSPWIGPGMVHKGYLRAFWSIYGYLREHIDSKSTIYFVGHGAGAAIAQLCGHKFRAEQVSCFSAPKLGNLRFREGYPRDVRVTRYENRCVLLTKYPLNGVVKEHGKIKREMFVHVGRAVRLGHIGASLRHYRTSFQSRKLDDNPQLNLGNK